MAGRPEDDAVRAAADAVLQFIALGERAFHEDSSGRERRAKLERAALLQAEEQLGPLGPELLPQFARILSRGVPRAPLGWLLARQRRPETPGRRFRSARVLGVSGRPEVATAPLIQALDDDEPLVRIAAADALHDLGNPEPEALGALRLALEDGNKRVRFHASLALAALNPRMSEALPALAEALGSPSWTTRDRAAAAIAEMGSAARVAAPLLLQALNQETAVPLKWKLRDAYARVNGVVIGHTIHGM